MSLNINVPWGPGHSWGKTNRVKVKNMSYTGNIVFSVKKQIPINIATHFSYGENQKKCSIETMFFLIKAKYLDFTCLLYFFI